MRPIFTGSDIELLGGGDRCYGVSCPTTEADLADGIGPARALTDAGSPLTLGSDSNAVIDLLEEARRVELGERLATQERGHFTAVELGTAATATGHASLGWAEAGELAAGAFADFVTIALNIHAPRALPRPRRWSRSSSGRPPPTSEAWSSAAGTS